MESIKTERKQNMWTLEDKIRFKNDLDNKQQTRLSLNSLRLANIIKNEIRQHLRKRLFFLW